MKTLIAFLLVLLTAFFAVVIHDGYQRTQTSYITLLPSSVGILRECYDMGGTPVIYVDDRGYATVAFCKDVSSD